MKNIINEVRNKEKNSAFVILLNNLLNMGILQESKRETLLI